MASPKPDQPPVRNVGAPCRFPIMPIDGGETADQLFCPVVTAFGQLAGTRQGVEPLADLIEACKAPFHECRRNLAPAGARLAEQILSRMNCALHGGKLHDSCTAL